MGVDIEVMKAGDGKTYPQKGQKVSCHYVLKLTNGKKIDSSRDRGKPFVFTIGKGEVIKQVKLPKTKDKKNPEGDKVVKVTAEDALVSA